MMAKLLAIIVVLVASVGLVVSPACAVVYVKWDSPGPSFDGNSWDTAYHSIQQGLNDAVTGGEEVRVARGDYVEQITLKAGVALKGGYLGVADTRDIRANVTVVDGSQAGGGHTVVGASSASIDGFTIYGGDEAIYSNATSPTISHNVIKGAASTGVYCLSSSAVIVNNVICGNLTGIMCDICSPTITGNTIVANDDIGICLSGQSRPTMSNNIVAFNAYGMYKWTATGDTAPTLTKNDVYGNTKANYTGVTAGGTDVSSDPLFISLSAGDLHIQSGSPCRNLGSNSAPSISSTDIDGQTRIEGTTVDIGADESYGETGGAVRVVYVNALAPDGPGFQVPSQQGGNWATAYDTIQAGIEDAFLLGGEVWVARGLYSEQVTMRLSVSMYGGFAGTESARSARVPSANRTVIDSPQPNVPSVWTANYATIDGFTIRGGYHGISCYYTSPTIANNVIVGNGKTGVHCHGGSAVITNNTIVGNDAGISCDLASPKIYNNIVAYNRTGIANTSGAPVLSRNDVYGSASSNYYGLSAGSGDIQLDPQFASLTMGDLHIQSGSPCRNAGLNTAPGLPAFDTDGQARVQGTAADMGADESYGETYSIPTRVLHVNAAAAPGGDGTSWPSAYKVVGSAIDDAALNGGAEVWVARGTYAEQVVMRPFAHLYGGFVGTEGARASRNVRANPTIIDGNSLEAAATVVLASSRSTLDGFTVTGGFVGVGSDFGSPTLANDTVCDNEAYGIVCGSSASVTGSLVFSNGNGVSCVSGRPTVSLNTIASNSTCGVTSGSRAFILGNFISGNAWGVECDYESPTLTNNTIVKNSAYGIIYDYASSPLISNNISAWNGYGIYNDLGTYASAGNTWGTPTLSRNDLFGNSANYGFLSVGPSDILVDPLLASLQFGNYHIQNSSPCRNAGSNTAPSLPSIAIDMDGQARIGGGTVDIGADEVYGETYPIPYPARIIHVNAAAPAGGNGATWATAYRSIQAAMQDAYSNGGAEVWVARGTYPENVLMAPSTYLYGGFVGTESSRSFRDPAANVTSVSAGGGSSAAVVTCAGSGGIDGFTVSGGGAGISAIAGSPVVSGNIVSACAGSGITCGDAAQVINCLVAGNGSGISCVAGAPTIVNNTVADNSQFGFSYAYGSSPKLINGVLAFNSIGVLADPLSPGAAMLSRNNSYGNSSANYSGRSPGGWDISSDPLFADRNAGDYHLQQASASIDAGDPSGSSWLLDDFNSYPDGSLGGHGGWTGGGSAVRVESGLAITGKAIEANYKSWGIGDASATVSPGTGYQYIDFDVAMNTAGASHGTNLGYVMFFGPTGTEITRIYFAAQVLKVLLGGVPTMLLDNVPNNAWQHIRLGIQASSTIDVWVNGIRVITGGSPYHADSSIARIVFGQWDLGTSFTTSETYLDNLMAQSPTAASIVPETDLDGTARPLDGNGDATVLADIGCYEYLPNRIGIPSAKAGADGLAVGISGPTSTASFADRFYIESPDGVSGIGVLGSVASYGKRVTVTGTMTTVDGERMVLPSSINEGAEAFVPRAPRMNIKALGGGVFGSQGGITGGFGVNNIGLLVSAFGWVTEIEQVESPAQPTWFKIEDSPGFSVKCLVPPGVTIDPGWSGVLVRGISSCEMLGGDLRPVLRVRGQDDVVPFFP